MNDRNAMARAKELWTGAVAMFGSLAGAQSGHLSGGHGRWVKATLTGALVLTGVIAWALALVQPWTSRASAMTLMATPAEVDTERLRSSAVDLETVINASPAPAAGLLKRSPFGPARSGTPMGAGSASKAGPSQAMPETRQMLDSVKGLKVEVILTTATGERWVVINGVNYREGDAVAGMEIVEIQGTRVKLQLAGTTCLLRMD
jgi:hypothetical protein